jgi:uncharacterized damage-inducible protein DinB
MQRYVETLRTTIDHATGALLALSDEQSRRRPAPGKWSARELIGHLIDSASNNHRRFVLAASSEDLLFDGYDQDAWVAVQRYRDEAWPDLVALWRAFNVHLAHVMSAVPASARERARDRHNLHDIAWRPMPSGLPATLDDLMEDYVAHLRHHLGQILGAGWDARDQAASGLAGR